MRKEGLRERGIDREVLGVTRSHCNGIEGMGGQWIDCLHSLYPSYHIISCDRRHTKKRETIKRDKKETKRERERREGERIEREREERDEGREGMYLRIEY